MRIVISRTDGGVSIMTIADTATDLDAEIDKWKSVHPGEYVAHRLMAPDEVMPERGFRNAWVDSGGKIDHDMGKARELVRDQLRAARMEKFSELDVAFLRAVEASDSKKLGDIAAKKQALRDITSASEITAATDPAELLRVQTALLARIGG